MQTTMYDHNGDLTFQPVKDTDGSCRVYIRQGFNEILLWLTPVSRAGLRQALDDLDKIGTKVTERELQQRAVETYADEHATELV